MARTDKNGRIVKTDKDIEREAKVAINRVISVHKGQAALKIYPEFRKAFPFGPNATDRERRIWEKLVMQANSELERWPLPLALALLLLAVPASRADNYNQPVLVRLNGEVIAIADPDPKTSSTEAAATVVAHRPSFSERHPKWHRLGRKARRICQTASPFVQFAGNVAQVLTVFKR